MLILRLQRTGTKNSPTFRIVLAQSFRSPSKKAVEVLGNYNPRSKELGIKNKERIEQLIANHTAVSPTVFNLLIEKQIITGKKVKAWQPKKKAVEATAEPKAATPSPDKVEAPKETTPEAKAEVAPASEAVVETKE